MKTEIVDRMAKYEAEFNKIKEQLKEIETTRTNLNQLERELVARINAVNGAFTALKELSATQPEEVIPA